MRMSKQLKELHDLLEKVIIAQEKEAMSKSKPHWMLLEIVSRKAKDELKAKMRELLADWAKRELRELLDPQKGGEPNDLFNRNNAKEE